jgi:peptide/nickel transport system ATP-binding protein
MIRINDVKASYFTPAGEVQALDRVSMTIRDDEVLGIAGESGCGKSTLIKVIYQFVEPPLRLLSGRVEATSRSAAGQPAVLDGAALRRAWWRYISYIPQGSMSVLNPVARVGAQFLDAAGVSAAFASRADLDARIAGYLTELNLPVDVLRAYPHQLSGGMRQRVIVALATFLHPQVILADEPTTALDVVVQRGIITMLAELQARERNTLVVVSHDMGVHYQLASRLAIMYAGKLVELADLDALVDRPLHPYTALLIGSLPRVGDRARREGIGGRPPRLLDPPPGCRFAARCPRKMAGCERVDPPIQEHASGHWVACHLHGEPASAAIAAPGPNLAGGA